MDSAARMIDRVPSLGPEREYRDICGCNVENFDYPINIMFASSMDILEGDVTDAMTRAAEELRGR